VARLFCLRAKVHQDFVLRATSFFALFFLKYEIIGVNFGYFLIKIAVDVDPKFDTGVAENLWRAALWPLLL